MKGTLLSTLVLVALSVTLIYAANIDNYAENSGFASTNYFCTCLVQNSTCYIGTAGSNVAIGGHRAQILTPFQNAQGVPWQAGCAASQDDYPSYCASGLAAQTGCPVTGCTGQYGTGGQLSLSTPPRSVSTLLQVWDGGCPTSMATINKVGLGGADLTDGGVSDSFNINIGKVDLQATLNIYVWTDANRASFASFDPSALSQSANLNGAYTRATLGFTSAFTTLNGSSGPADFSNVGAIALEIVGSDSLDLIIALVETAGALTLSKYSNLTTDQVPIGIAGTGDVITFNLTLSYSGLGSPVSNVYIWDDPARNFKTSPSAYFPYYTLVPGSLIVNTFTIDPTTLGLTPANLSYTEINGPNVASQFGRIVLFLGNVTEYTSYNIFFAVQIPSSLPCCLPLCRAQCNTSSGGESCHCIANTAYFCEFQDSINLNGTNAAGQQPNFTTAFVDANCGFSTVPAEFGAPTNTAPQITVTPVYAPSSPYVVFTSNPPASAQPGQSVCTTFAVGNNGTRDTAAVVTLSYNPSVVAPTQTGSSSGFTCSGSSCVSGLNQYAAGSTASYTLCFTAATLTTCTNVSAQFSVAIAPNGCNTTTIPGPVGRAPNGTEINGTVAVTPCVDVNNADNSATSTPTSISGTAILAISSNFSSSSVAPQGQSILSICYSNSGNSPANSAVVTVTLPSGTSASGTSWTVSGSSATYNVGTISTGVVCSPLPALTVTYTASTLTCQNAVLNFPVALTSDCGSASTSSTLTPTGTTAITVSKTANVATATQGSTILYTISFTNSGARQFDTVTLSDTVPANTVYTGTNGWSCSPNNNAGSVCTATLPANTTSVPFQVVVNANITCDVTSIQNTVSAFGFCAGSPASFQTSTVTAVAVVNVTGNPDFFVTKVATDGNGNTITGVQAGQQVTYVITYGNRGQRVSSATVIESGVSSPFTFVGPAAWSTPNANGQRTVTVSNVAPGQTGNLTFVVQAASTLLNCAGVSAPNTVSISANAPCVDNNLADNNASTSVTVTGSVDLYIYFVPVSTYTIPTSTTANLQFCYGNNGNTGATNASMTVTLPNGITAASTGNSGFVINGQTVTYFIGSVAASQAAQCRTLVVNLPTTLNCTDLSYNQTASITSDCFETNTTNNVTPYSFAVTGTFDLFITKSQPTNITLTQSSPQVTYSLGYGNNGVKTVTPVIITEFLPANTQFVASASDSRWVAAGNGVYTLNLGTVAANSASSSPIAFTVTLNLPVPTGLNSITNSASISNNGVCGSEVTLTNNNASVTTPIVGNPDLFVLKTNNGASFFGTGNTQSTVVYTISYGNNGQADAVNATLTETVPPNTVYSSAGSNSQWSCTDGAVAGTVCTANIGRVPIAANGAQNVVFGSVTFAVTAAPYSGALTSPALRCPTSPTVNFVSIAVASPQVDLNQANNQANATTPFLGLPNLYIAKSVQNPTQVRVSGDVIVYNISYGNNGIKDAVNAIITDTIPEYTVFNAGASSLGFNCPNGGAAGSNCSFNAGNIAAGQTGSLTLAVTLLPGFPADAFSTTNFVEISNQCEGGNETTLIDNFASVIVNITGFYDLVLQKHGYCESILYTMNYINVGNIGARDVFLLTYIPQDTSFDANNSAPGWICNANTPGAACRYNVTVVDPRFPGVLDFLAAGASGSVNFAVTPYPHSMSSTFTLDTSIDANFAGEDLDPTPDNNRASTTVGFSGCAACDSCCPAVDQCCPDYTDVSFVFGGVLDGLNTCS